MKPDRVLLAELRSKVAYDYIVNISSGHPGSITTVHAGSAAGAFEMLMLRVKESDEGAEPRSRRIQGCCAPMSPRPAVLSSARRPRGPVAQGPTPDQIHYDPSSNVPTWASRDVLVARPRRRRAPGVRVTSPPHGAMKPQTSRP